MKLTVQDLDAPIPFAPIPFRNGSVDLGAHAKNIRYLVDNNFLDGGRPRIIATGGSSLIHHLSADEQLDLARVTCEIAGGRAWHISGVLPTPTRDALRVIREQMRLANPPDAFLMMPVAGVYNPEGVANELRRVTGTLAAETGARFILYLRDSALREQYARLAAESDHILGVKIGTGVADVAPVREVVGDSKAVVWGIGDLSTEGIKAGARGHTSGTAIICSRLVDELNNAHRRRDFDAALKYEEIVRPLEEIRFTANRAWNYSAVVAVMKLQNFDDVDPGDGGPFNATPPAEVMSKIPAIAQQLRSWHRGAQVGHHG